jgi:hypothetical protein
MSRAAVLWTERLLAGPLGWLNQREREDAPAVVAYPSDGIAVVSHPLGRAHDAIRWAVARLERRGLTVTTIDYIPTPRTTDEDK